MEKCLRFVITGQTPDERSVALLKKAAHLAAKKEIDVGWLEADDFENGDLALGEEVILVCEAFEGPAFEKIKSCNRKIVGPQCILTCIEHRKSLPEAEYPLLNMAMHDLITCCTGIPPEEREKLRKYIEQMGGIMINDFTHDVTHLIADEVGSQKYEVACRIGSRIMQVSWVYDVYEKNKFDYIFADHQIFQRHICPCFKGITLCVTGMSSKVREEIKQRTEENGGRYSKDLNMRTCTHLMVKNASGEKYDYARRWKIHCVSSQWFFDCLESGHWVKEDSYKVQPGDESRLDESQLLNASRSRIDMTVMSDMNVSTISSRAAEVAQKRMKMRKEQSSLGKPKNSGPASELKIRSFDMSNFDTKKLKLSASGCFLDGCKLYLSGFSLRIMGSLRKLVNSAGGMWITRLNDGITHIILGDSVSKEIEDFLQKNIQRPHVVSPEWLVDSCLAGENLSEKDYSLVEENHQETLPSETSTLPAQNTSTLSSSGIFRKPTTNRRATSHMPSFQVDDDLDDDCFLDQYLPQAESSRISFPPDHQKTNENPDDQQNKICNMDFQQPEHIEAIAGSDELRDQMETSVQEAIGNLFIGQTFAVKFFDEDRVDQIKSLIEQYGGELIGAEAKSHHIIVPLRHETKRRISKKEVTVCWLEQSLEREEILERNSSFIFRPFFLPLDCLPLVGCVLAISQFNDLERQHLEQLATLLGADVQEALTRKTLNNLRPNTHLLLMEASGPKYKAACEWGVCCVSKEWLFACAAKKALVKPEKYKPSKVTEANGQEEQHSETAMTTLGCQDETRLNSENTGTDTRTTLEVSKDLMPRPVLNTLERPATNNVAAAKESERFITGITPLIEGLQMVATPLPPKKMMRISSSYRPSFDLTEAMEYLRSPSDYLEPKFKSGDDSLDEEWVSCQIRKAAEFTKNQGVPSVSGEGLPARGADQTSVAEPPETGEKEGVEESSAENAGILAGVVIAVSKKLAQRQIELHNLASALGADCRFMFDDSCTHLINQGKTTDAVNEVKQARSQGKFIVSSYWLDACLEENRRVDEELYPCTYNPKKALEVVPRRSRASRSMASGCSARGKKSTIETFSNETTIDYITRTNEAVSSSSASRRRDDANTTANASNATAKAANTTANASNTTANASNAAIQMETTRETLQSKSSTNIDPNVSSDSGGVFEKQGEPTATTLQTSPPCLKETSSLDARIQFKKQMEEIMEATKGNKEDSRRSRRHLQTRRLRSKQSSQRSSSESLRSSNDRKSGKQAAPMPSIEPSQGDIISYDDPAGRMERERILAQLKAASPSQDVEQDFQPVQERVTVMSTDEKQAENPVPETATTTASRRSEEQGEPSSPQPPPINLPITHPIQAPDPVNLLEQVEVKQEKKDCSSTHRFLLSSMSPQEKIRYSALIEELGGVQCDSVYFTTECTHVVAGNPSRNEKFLASLAAGKWVLHKSFLEASREAGFFVQEDLHEWGTEAEPTRLSSAAHRWRKKLSAEREKNPSAGAFEGWTVVLCVGSGTVQNGLKRMLEAGGGVVKSSSPPFNNIDGVTHALIDQRKMKPGTIDFLELHSAGIWVLRSEYLMDYLLQDPAPPMLKYIAKEVQKLSEIETSPFLETTYTDAKKRKTSDPFCAPKTKRSKS